MPRRALSIGPLSGWRRFWPLLALGLTCTIPASASAEVMDKMPSLVWLCPIGLAATIAVVGLGYVRSELTVLATPLTSIGVMFPLLELLDPHVGPAMWAEDSMYVVLAWLLVLAQLAAYPVGIVLGMARRRRRRAASARPRTF